MPFYARTRVTESKSHPFRELKKSKHLYRKSAGVFRVYIPNEKDEDREKYYVKPPNMQEFYEDYLYIVKTMNLGPVRSGCSRTNHICLLLTHQHVGTKPELSTSATSLGSISFTSTTQSGTRVEAAKTRSSSWFLQRSKGRYARSSLEFNDTKTSSQIYQEQVEEITQRLRHESECRYQG